MTINNACLNNACFAFHVAAKTLLFMKNVVSPEPLAFLMLDIKTRRPKALGLFALSQNGRKAVALGCSLHLYTEPS
jgi:hypothetical protein